MPSLLISAALRTASRHAGRHAGGTSRRTALQSLPAALSTAAPRPPARTFSTADDAEQDMLKKLWDKPDLHHIFDNNREWRKKMLSEDPKYFENLAKGQEPEYLLIGCSDSRVGAQEIMGLNQGELFVHRNIANVFVTTDLNLLSVLFYSVNVLKVKEILVLGHYECGGVRAASQNKDLGLIEHWLHNIRDVQRLHKEELSAYKDPEKRHRRLVELNVQEQCFNLFSNSIVQQMQAKTGRPRVHGMVYDIANGRLKYLDIDFKAQIRKYRDIYTVADFRHHEPVDIRDVGRSDFKGELDRRDLARHLFDAIDHDKSGTIGKDDIRKAMRSFTDDDVSDEELDEAMRPLVGLDRDHFDLDAFEAILEQIHHISHEKRHETDRLVVIRPTGGQDPPRPLRCNASTTVMELKDAISTLMGMPMYQQKLSFMGRPLDDDSACLVEVGIKDIAEVELHEEIVPSGFKRP